MASETVTERWYGQGDEVGGLHVRIRANPRCEMMPDLATFYANRAAGGDGSCQRPATVRVNQIDGPPEDRFDRYPSDKYWCAEHAALLARCQ